MNIIVTLEEQKGAYILKPSRHACERQARGMSETTLAFLLEGKLYQGDYDFVRLARMLGKPDRLGRRSCEHRGTDGTVTCPDCGRTPGQFIAGAQDWLDARIGDTFRVSSQVLGWE